MERMIESLCTEYPVGSGIVHDWKPLWLPEQIKTLTLRGSSVYSTFCRCKDLWSERVVYCSWSWKCWHTILGHQLSGFLATNPPQMGRMAEEEAFPNEDQVQTMKFVPQRIVSRRNLSNHSSHLYLPWRDVWVNSWEGVSSWSRPWRFTVASRSRHMYSMWKKSRYRQQRESGFLYRWREQDSNRWVSLPPQVCSWYSSEAQSGQSLYQTGHIWSSLL